MHSTIIVFFELFVHATSLFNSLPYLSRYQLFVEFRLLITCLLAIDSSNIAGHYSFKLSLKSSILDDTEAFRISESRSTLGTQ